MFYNTPLLEFVRVSSDRTIPRGAERMPRACLAQSFNPRARGVWPRLTHNARGLWGGDCRKLESTRLLTSHFVLRSVPRFILGGLWANLMNHLHLELTVLVLLLLVSLAAVL